MNKLITLVGLMGLALSSAGFAAADNLPVCPDVSAVKNVNFHLSIKRQNGQYLVPAKTLNTFDSKTPWIIYARGFQSGSITALADDIRAFDTAESTKAVEHREFIFSIPVCKYTASNNPALELVAIPMIDSLGLFSGIQAGNFEFS